MKWQTYEMTPKEIVNEGYRYFLQLLDSFNSIIESLSVI